jgi:iron complex outermembrane recepter protein
MEVLPPARIPANEVAVRRKARGRDCPIRRRGSRPGLFVTRLFMTSIVHPLRAPACLIAAAASLCVTGAFAQSSTLKPTVVSATRFAEPAASLPLGVSVITADEIRRSGAVSVNDALVRVLGLPGRQDLFNGGDTTVDLRGFGVTAEANQIVILDGLRLTEGDLGGTRMAGIPIDSIERIEVLRGSGAVLYGEGATGGVIVITTKAGSGQQQASGATLYGGAGSDGLRDLRASGVVSTANGFTLDAYAQKRESDGYRANQASDLKTGDVTGQWSNGTVRFGARLAQDDLDARLPGALSAAQYQADPSQASRPNDFASIRNERASVFAQADVGSWQFAFDAGQREKKLRSMNAGFPFDYDVDAKNYALRARNESAFDSVKNILVLGGDFNDWQRNVLGAFGSVANQQTRGWYAKDDVVLQGGTRFSLGARTDRVEKDESSSGTAIEDRQNAWELGVSHPFGAGWTGYVRTGRSFRLANVDEFSFTQPGVILQPQVSRDTELGTRWDYGGGNLQARLYRSNLTNEIGFDPTVVGAFGFFGANINFDPTRRQGLELDWSHALTPAFTTRVTAAVRRATFRSGPHDGKDVPLVPRETLALRGDWVPVAGHRINAGVNWVSSQHPDFDNACKIPSYTTADARYAWQFHPHAELGLGVTNLFDRKFYTQAFGCAGGQTTAIYPEAPRQFTASLRLQF